MNENIIDQLSLEKGMQVDLNEGWHKIISRQFGGNPGRGFAELIQNLIDSYDSTVPMEERKGDIHTGPSWISITDYGSGLGRNKLQLLTTLGGTDKAGDKNKIGAFGIGFFSIFNPKLSTKKVEVLTCCEGQTVKLVFTITETKTPPDIAYELMAKKFKFSTQIKVHFEQAHGVTDCISAMNRALKFYPCNINVNGVPFQSIWQSADERNHFSFSTESIKGFVQPSTYDYRVSLMCKYENLGTMSMNAFLTGGHGTKYTIDDLSSNKIPCLPETHVYVNDNDLTVTISRDSFYLDHNWRRLKTYLSKVLLDYLGDKIQDLSADDILANMFILRDDLFQYLKTKDRSAVASAIVHLAHEKVFRIDEKEKLFSLADIYRHHNPKLPLFFSPGGSNLRWLGGDFKHDFIVLPPQTLYSEEIDSFWDILFKALFKDVVNLESIIHEAARLQELVDRKIISRDALKTESKVIGSHKLSAVETHFLNDIKELLSLETVKQVIETSLQLKIKSVLPVFIKFENNNTYISSGLLDKDGVPIDDQFISNLKEDQRHQAGPVHLLLGLSQDHPFVQKLIHSKNPHRAYFSLTYIAHELALSQKLLAPYSSFFHLVKNKLANNVRRALIENIAQSSKN
ncbi:hypothetical protein GF407_02195 [candidate division KSB1 bacterium]|nr:hypothetical protein [candidate division KSB1 bacterium]